MKKNMIVPIIGFIIILCAGLGVHYLLSLRKVTLVIQKGTDSITLYTSKNKTLKELSATGSIQLQEGTYYIIPKGKNIDDSKFFFNVENTEKTITVQPAYTTSFLASLLPNEIDEIKDAILKKYPNTFTSYTLSQGSLYGRGEWYGGLLKPVVSDNREQKDPYRVVLHKEKDTWNVVRRPEYTLNASRYKDVPIEILRKINAIVGEPEN